MTDGSNAIDPDLARSLFDEDDEIEDQLLALQMEYMQKCKPFRAKQKEAFKAAVEQGMPKVAWRLQLKEHRIKRGAARQIENLYKDVEEDDVESADMIREAVGEDYASLPLGAAAVRRAEGKKPKAEAPAADTKKKGRGRPRKDSAAPAAAPANDDGDDDPRPQFLKDKDAQRQEDAAERLKGMKTLGDESAPKTIN